MPFCWDWNGSWQPDPGGATPPTVPAKPHYAFRWFDYLARYTNGMGTDYQSYSYQIFTCPTQPQQNQSILGQTGFNPAAVSAFYEFGRPSWVYPGRSGVGTTSNYASTLNSCQEDPNTPSSWASRAMKTEDILALYSENAGALGTPFTILDGVERVIPPGGGEWYDYKQPYAFVHPNKSVNVLFYDGHVERHVPAHCPASNANIGGLFHWVVGVKN